MPPKLTVVILAAGFGKRMRSQLPKVLHPVCGVPMLEHSIRAAEAVSGEVPVVIIGHGADSVRRAMGDRVRYVMQEEQLGTAHALQQAETLLNGNTDQVVLIYGDMPLLTAETLRRVIRLQAENTGPVSLLSVLLDDPHGFGRILRGDGGTVEGIIEEAQTTEETYHIKELNTGIYCFDGAWLWPALHRIQKSPKGEYYLTDIVAVARADGLQVLAEPVSDPLEALGVNTREHLAEAAQVMQRRIQRKWMNAGVTLINPLSITIDIDARIGEDTTLYPGCSIYRKSTIGKGCRLGPNALIINAQVGDDVRGANLEIHNCQIPDGAELQSFMVYQNDQDV